MSYLVTNGNDSGPGSLRDGVIFGNSNPGTTITFDPSVTLVTLSSGTLTITADMTINGNGTANTNVTSSNTTFPAFTLTAGNVNISNLKISNVTNLTGNGGAMLVTGILTHLVLDHVVVDTNNCLGGGGGISCGSSSIVDIYYCTISNNLSGTDNGGGINCIDSTLNVYNTVVNNNDAPGVAGGIYAFNSNVKIVNSTFYQNTSFDRGGVSIDTSTFEMTNCTIANNSVLNNCGGLYLFTDTEQTFVVQNTIIANNTAVTNYPDVQIEGIVVLSNSGYNLIGIDDNGFFINGVDGNIVGSTATPVNPMFGPFQNNGGPTSTLALLTSSPAINKGNNLWVIGILYDQRGIGYQRIAHGIVDIGAFENQGAICYSGDSLVLTKNVLTGEIQEIKARDVTSIDHLVYSVSEQKFVPIKYNIVTGTINRFMLIKKDALGINKPNADFYITSGHRIFINEQEIKAKHIPQATRTKTKSQLVYSICIENHGPILVNGLPVIAWGHDEWLNYVFIRGIVWEDNKYH